MLTTTIQTELETLFADLASVVARADEGAFFAKESDARWSPAEEVQHLALTYIPVSGMLARPKIMRRRWGASEHASRDYDSFMRDYKQATSTQAWKTFPPFVPMRENEPEGYMELHASDRTDKVKAFYEQSGGERAIEIRATHIWNETTTKADVLAFFQEQSGKLLAGARSISDADLDECRLPLPYIGMITARESLYFTLSHTRHHLGSVRKKL
jgi:hypothetical protein